MQVFGSYVGIMWIGAVESLQSQFEVKGSSVLCKTNSIPICFSLAEKSLCMIKLVTRALPVRYGRYLVFNNHSSPDFGVRPQSPSGWKLCLMVMFVLCDTARMIEFIMPVASPQSLPSWLQKYTALSGIQFKEMLSSFSPEGVVERRELVNTKGM